MCHPDTLQVIHGSRFLPACTCLADTVCCAGGAGKLHPVEQCVVLMRGNTVADEGEILHTAINAEGFFVPVMQRQPLLLFAIDIPSGEVSSLHVSQFYRENMPSRPDGSIA